MGLLDKISGAASSAVHSIENKVSSAVEGAKEVAHQVEAKVEEKLHDASTFDPKPSAPPAAGAPQAEGKGPVIKASQLQNNFVGDLWRKAWGTDKPAAPPPAPPPPAAPPTTRPDSIQPKNAIVAGDAGGLTKLNGETVRSYQTGDNITKVADGNFEISDADAASNKGKQDKIVQDMAASLKHPVGNPPSIADSQAYFQNLAGKGTKPEVDNMKNEYGKYLSTFYQHAGIGGVEWGAGKNLANNLENSLSGQPTLKDGKKLVDCEGFAALNERILGGIQDPATKKPMFELMHTSSGNHILTGVFKKGDPLKEPFVVNNDKVGNLAQSDIDNLKKLARPGTSAETNEKFLMKQYFEHQDKFPSAQKWGHKFDDMKPFGT